MTKAQLIKALQNSDAPDDIQVKFAYNSGDHWRTTIAADIRVVEEGDTKYSDYHSKDVLVERDGDDEIPAEGTTPALILSNSRF